VLASADDGVIAMSLVRTAVWVATASMPAAIPLPITSVRAKQLKHSRSLLPLGGWASDIKRGALSFELAREILRDPDQWPGDLAQRAAEKIGTRLASKASTLAATAHADAWIT
jgi:hypothetical protein